MSAKNKYIKRLVEEWKKHKHLVIFSDFDDTLSPWSLNDHTECQQVINLLKECKFTGAYIGIHTACNSDRYPEIISYLKSKGLEIDSINKNPINLPYGNESKPYGNIYLDDRAGLEEAKYMLESALYEYRGYLEGQKHLDEIG